MAYQKPASRWSYGRWADSLGIGRGLEGCEGKTLAKAVVVDTCRQTKPCRDCDAYECTYRPGCFVLFTDGTRRFLETDEAWGPMEDYRPLLDAGFLTAEDADRIERGRGEERALSEAERQRTAAAREAARIAYEAAYKAAGQAIREGRDAAVGDPPAGGAGAMLTRRGFLPALAAPFLVRTSGLLMPIKPRKREVILVTTGEEFLHYYYYGQPPSSAEMDAFCRHVARISGIPVHLLREGGRT